MENNNLNNIKNNGFKTPDNYFDGLEDRLLDEIKLKEKVSNSGFTTPNGYLDNFQVNIPSNEPSNKKETKIIKLVSKKTLLFASSIAATIVLFFSLNIFGTETSNTSIDSLATDIIDEYILEETDISDLASLFEEDELSEDQFIDYNLNEDTLDAILESEDLNELFTE